MSDAAASRDSRSSSRAIAGSRSCFRWAFTSSLTGSLMAIAPLGGLQGWGPGADAAPGHEPMIQPHVSIDGPADAPPPSSRLNRDRSGGGTETRGIAVVSYELSIADVRPASAAAKARVR